MIYKDKYIKLNNDYSTRIIYTEDNYDYLIKFLNESPIMNKRLNEYGSLDGINIYGFVNEHYTFLKESIFEVINYYPNSFSYLCTTINHDKIFMVFESSCTICMDSVETFNQPDMLIKQDLISTYNDELKDYIKDIISFNLKLKDLNRRYKRYKWKNSSYRKR